MKIAVEGCAHGELEKIYECIETIQEREGIKIDLLICCGDFQSVRNGDDLCAMAVPEKYQNMCTFYKYYSGERRAPVLTIFIGGNHEASNYLQELPFGGWVAPNIYYLGRAGVIRLGDLRIGGMSGIYKGKDYLQGLWECPPYNQQSLRSVYHVRAIDSFRLQQLKEKVHIMLSHDWPRNITDYGDKEGLLSFKPFLREDVEAHDLGSAPAERLLHSMKPTYWFSAHLHCQFVAIVKHDDGEETKFLALDKCLPKRRHLQIVDVPQEYDGDLTLKHDAEWLAVLKNTNYLVSVKNVDCHMPGPGGSERYDFTPTEEEKEAILSAMGDMTISEESFVRTAPVYQPGKPKRHPVDPILNPQTVHLCEKLGIDDPLQVLMARSGRTMRQPHVEIANSPAPTPVQTPMKLKMSLPAPSTPIVNDSVEDIEDQPAQKDSLFSPPSFLSESVCSSTADSPIVPSEGPKKTFKRRNLAMYTPDADDSVSTSSSFLDDSPKSSKYAKDVL
ncbi:lariat debranching enzyme [Phthorimaea operculella]|nr:lariat debranching enzyme [Phthorimaea operculella]